MDLVSIIVPIYNSDRYIRACIKSIQNQSYENIEIIIVNDGSNDRSEAICEGLRKEDERIQVFHQAQAGVSAARNYGIRIAQGKYVMFVDADDTIGPNMVKDNYLMAEEHQADLVICCFRYLIVDAGKNIPNGLTEDFSGNPKLFFEKYFEMIMERELLNPPWNKFIRKRLLDKSGIWFNCKYSICEDMAFSAEVLTASEKIAVNHNIYYNYYIKSKGTLVYKFHENYFEALSNFYFISLKYCKMFTDNHRQIKSLDSLYARSAIMYIKQICCKSNWDKSQKKRAIEEVLQDKALVKALDNATLDWKKNIIRVLSNRQAYDIIYKIYRIQNMD